MHIQRSARDGCIVVTLAGDLDIAAAPEVQWALLKGLAEQPDAVICDLSKVARIDPVCASVFAAVAHRPRSHWPDSSVLLCGIRPAVAAVLPRGMPLNVPVCDTLDQAIAQARSRPGFLRERLGLAPTLEAVPIARWFVGEACRRWQLDELAETAQSLAAEVVTDAALDQPTAATDLIELRMELRATGLLLAFHRGASSRAVTHAGHQGDPGAGLEVVRRLAQRWGTRRQADDSRVLWCLLRRPPTNAHERPVRP